MQDYASTISDVGIDQVFVNVGDLCFSWVFHLSASVCIFLEFTMVFKMLHTVNGRVGHVFVSDGDSTACIWFIALLRSE